MPDIGSTGTDHAEPLRANGLAQQRTFKALRFGVGPHNVSPFSSRDNVEGYLTAPSLDIVSLGRFRFRWAMASGARTIACWVKHPSDATPRPSLVVRANPDIGVNVDVTGTAASSATWVQIGPLAVNPTSDGATWVELRNNCDRQTDHCYFDRIQTL